MKLTDEQKIKMREFLADQGRPVKFTGREGDYQPVSTYGWQDEEAWEHVPTARTAQEAPTLR